MEIMLRIVKCAGFDAFVRVFAFEYLIDRRRIAANQRTIGLADNRVMSNAKINVRRLTADTVGVLV